MGVKQRLLALADMGVRVSVTGEKLIFEGNLKALTPDIREFLKENKPLIIDFLSVRARNQPARIPRNQGGEQPLSFAQQRLWLVHQLNPESGQYNMPMAIHLRGDLDINALHRALDRIVARHAVLRTVVKVDTSGDVRQVILDHCQLALPLVDLSSDPEPESSAVEIIREALDKPFDLERDLMLRSSLIRLTEDSHILLINMHHIVADGWSMSLLTRELSALYDAFLSGDSDPLPALSLQYSDYAAWQRTWVSGERLEQQLEHWRQALSGIPTIHELPLDYPRPAIATFRGGRYTHRLPTPLKDRLQELAQAQDVTLFMLMNSAFSTLLARYSGSTDIAIGTPVANRDHAELAPLVGFFINTLVVRSDLSGNPSFVDLLAQSRERLLAAYENQQVPFEQLLEELQPERSLSHQPVVQILLSLHNNEKSDMSLTGLECQFLEQGTHQARYDLTLNVTEQDDGTLLLWEYALDLFKEETVKRMSHHLERLLEKFAENPQHRVLDVDFRTQAESGILTSERPAPSHDRDSVLVLQQFRNQVATTPEAIAVVCDGVALSYRELDQKTGRLARHLEESGVEPRSLVGLCAERSIELIIGVLGTLKAGAAYVPLEPTLPEARLRHVMSDADIDLVLIQSHLSAKIPLTAADIVLLDDASTTDEWLAGYDGEEDSLPGMAADGEAPAYAIYTSGSTGKPKGVLISHGNLGNYLSHATGAYAGGTVGGVLSSTLAFDATVTSLFVPLLTGGTLIVLSQQQSGIEALADVLRDAAEPLVFKLTPAHMEALLPLLKGIHSPAAHRLIIGGDQLPATLVSQWREHVLPRAEYVNEYGPTEATVGCIVETVSHLLPEAGAVPIGRPIRNSFMRVLDRNGRPTPVGVFGELYIGGAGLAIGYLNQPALTAERFPSLDAGDGQLRRYYRTGDRVRWLDDGRLEFAERIDNQVKLRGFRIELGEIESLILGFPAVTLCAVLLHRDLNQIVAFVAGLSDGAERRDLSRLVAQSLPSYMVPNQYIWLADIPLTVNGKIDRDALITMVSSTVEEAGYEAPRNLAEQVVCDAWARALKREQVGIQENFFSLGGDSIRVIQAVRYAQDQGVHITVADIFAHQTIAALSSNGLLSAEGAASAEVPLHLLSRHLPEEFAGGGEKDLYPVTSLQQRMLDMANARILEPGTYHPQLVFDIHDMPIDVTTLRRVCRHLFEKHTVLRTSFRRASDGSYVQFIRDKIALDVNSHNLRAQSDKAKAHYVQCLIQEDTVRPFCAESDEPLIRMHLCTMSDDHHCLFISMHHAIEDGWGFMELMQDMLSLYSGLATGRPLPAETPCHVFKERVALEIEAGKSDQEMAAWQRSLSTYTPMPSFAARPAWDETEANELTFKLPASLADKLATFARLASLPVKNVLLLAYMGALSRLLDTRNITVDVVTNGRTERLSDPMNAFGLFWNLLPVTLPLAGSPAEDLAAVSEQLHHLDVHCMYPADQLAKMQGVDDLTCAAFNFVSYHNTVAVDAVAKGTAISLRYSRDRFHHAIKLFASADPQGSDIVCKLEFSRRFLSPEQIEWFRSRFLSELEAICVPVGAESTQQEEKA